MTSELAANVTHCDLLKTVPQLSTLRVVELYPSQEPNLACPSESPRPLRLITLTAQGRELISRHRCSSETRGDSQVVDSIGLGRQLRSPEMGKATEAPPGAPPKWRATPGPGNKLCTGCPKPLHRRVAEVLWLAPAPPRRLGRPGRPPGLRAAPSHAQLRAVAERRHRLVLVPLELRALRPRLGRLDTDVQATGSFGGGAAREQHRLTAHRSEHLQFPAQNTGFR